VGLTRLVADTGGSGSLLRFAKRYATAAGGALYAFTLGVGAADNRRIIQQLARQFGHRDGDAPRLPVVAIDRITSSATPVVLAEPIANDGNVTLLELLVLSRLVRERRPQSLFEIGTFDGRTTLALAMNAPHDAVVYTLDLPPLAITEHQIERSERKFVDKPAPGARFRNTDASRNIRQLYGDSATFDFTPHSADFVFVDGSHAYEYVLNDSERVLGLLGARAGTIVWHDYGEWPGVTRALDELATTDQRFAGLRWIEGTTLAVLDREA
jgi:predicted O-methyltransferase YrrM